MLAVWCLRLSVIYLVVGMSMGMYMGMNQDFTLSPVHAHVNLLGFVVLALAGLVFVVFPELAATRLATAFFWLYNLGSPPALLALAFVLNGHDTIAGPILVVTETMIWIGGFLFAVNLLFNLRSLETAAGRFLLGAAVSRGR